MTPKSEEQKGKEGVGGRKKKYTCVVLNYKIKIEKISKFVFFIIEILKLLAAVITKSKTLQQKLDESAFVSKMM